MKTRTSPALILLIVFLVFVYIRPYEFIPVLEKFKITKVSVLIALFFSFFEQTRKSFIYKEKSFRLFVFLQLLPLILLPISIWKGNSIDFWMSSCLRLLIVFYLLLVIVNNRIKFNLIINTIFMSCSFVAIRVILAFYRGYVIYDSDGTRRVVGVSTMTSSDPNDLALMLAMAIPIGIYLVYTNRHFLKKHFYLGLTLLNSIAILYTGSRGGYLGFLIGVLAFFLIMYRKYKAKLIAVLGIMAILLAVLLPAEYKARFMSSFDTQQYSYSDERYGRVAIWKRGMRAMISAPQGIGLKNYSIADGKVKRVDAVTGKWNVAHNSYLQIGVELGILGLILYILFLFSGFRNIKKTILIAGSNKDYAATVCSYAFAASILAFMISSFFLSQAYYWSHYIIIALTVTLKNILLDKPQPTENKATP